MSNLSVFGVIDSMEHYQYINIEKTLQEFGYHIDDLRPNSQKLVYRICQICKKESIKTFGSIYKFKQYKCLECSNKINANTNIEIKNKKIKDNWKKNGHSRLGKQHSDSTKKIISDKCKNHKLTKEQINKHKDYFKKNGGTFLGKKHSKQSRDKMSVIHKKIARRGKDCNFYGKTYYSKKVKFTDKLGRVFNLKSSWEVKVAKYLDEQNLVWDYEKKFFPVIYTYDNEIKNGTYIPDFFVNDEIWEVKGYWRKDAKVKYEAFLQQYPNVKIKLLQKEQLLELGIKF